MLDFEARQRNISVSLTGDAGAGPVLTEGDPVLLRQAVLNLVQNTIRHNHDGGTVTLQLEQCDMDTVITITNTGPLVPEAGLAALIEPFVRGAGRTAGGSRGLGLAITTSIVEVHHGELLLNSNPAGGLTARLILRAEHANLSLSTFDVSGTTLATRGAVFPIRRR